MTETLQALRQKLGAEKATAGTRRDYLRWLIGRNMYLDPRGTFQTQRQVQVKLDEVYISLRAQRDETPGTADRHLLEKELADLEMTANLSAEEMEDRREYLQARFERRLIADKPAETLELAGVVTRYDRVVILGDPGSGKTTLLRYLALKHADALWNGRIEAGADLGIAHFPILIRIAEYAEDGNWKKKSLSEFLAESYMLHDCPRNGLADLLQTELEKGNCLVLLDGLDEIVSADERLGVVKQIEDFVRHHIGKANCFVITSRKAGYRSAPLAEPFTHYAVQEMDETQMRRFLERWCQTVEDAQTPELSVQERRNVAKREIESIMRAVQASPGVRRLAANPLLLRTLALIHHTGATLPQKRIELYKLAADTLARTWRPAQGVPESALVKEEYLTPLLSTLAYWLHVNKPTSIATEREVYEVLGREWARLNDMHWDDDDPNPKITAEVRKFLAAVREHTGLFVERAPRRYGFMHLTFEEYYVARHLVARSKTRAKLLRQHLHQPRWEEPILLALGFVGLEYPAEARELVETAVLAEGEEAQMLELAPSKYEEWLGRDFLFALCCLGDDIPVRPRLRQQLMERLVEELLHESGPARFERYRKALEERLACVQASDTIVVPRLLAALQDHDAWVRARAAECLGRLGNASPRVFKILMEMLLQDAHGYVRHVVAHSLSRLHHRSPDAVVPPEFYSPEVFNTWVVALGIDPRSFERPKVTKEEFEAREAYMLNEWVVALQQSTDAQVRLDAARGLGNMGALSKEPWKICHALIGALQQDTDAEVRVEAATCLGLGGDMGQNVPEILAALVTALQQDAEAKVRSRVIWSLEQLENTSPEVLAALVTALQQDADIWVRSRAAECLGQLGKAFPEVLAALTVAFQQAAETDVRSMAAWSLVQLRQVSFPLVESTLLEGVQEAKYASIRSDCARLLGEMGQADEPTQQVLWYGLLDRYGDVRAACEQALVRLAQRFPEALVSIKDKLVQVLTDPAFKQLDAPVPDEPGIERPAYDYAYDGLWLLVVGGELEKA